MRVLFLSQDRSILNNGKSQERMVAYGTIFTRVTIVVFGSGHEQEKNLGNNVSIIFPGGSNTMYAFIRGVRCVFKMGTRDAYDLFGSQDPFFLGVIGLFLSLIRKIPLQVQVHTDCFSRGYITESPRRAFEAMLAYLVLHGVSCARVVSERVAVSVRKITSAPVTVLPIQVVVDTAPQQKPTAFRDAFTAITVARLSHEKQLSLVIDAIALTEGIDLLLVGDGPLRERLEMRVKSLGLEERVRFVGKQENTAAYYQYAHAFVQCSRYEGYGMSLIEAALFGLPIVTTNVGVVNDILRDQQEVLVVPATKDAIAQALMRYKLNVAFGKVLGAHAKARARLFQKSMEEYLAEYQKAALSCLTVS